MSSEPDAAQLPLLLVVDDEPQVLRFLRASLPHQGYRVIEATTGEEGLRQAATRAPDAILLDLGLPDLDGVEVTRRLREWSTVPVIVLSARGQESDKIEALDAGADDYLTKPFGIGELLARLRPQPYNLRIAQVAAALDRDPARADLGLTLASLYARKNDFAAARSTLLIGHPSDPGQVLVATAAAVALVDRLARVRQHDAGSAWVSDAHDLHD